MQPLLSRNLTVFLTILGCMFAVWRMDDLWSQSVDLAHHYALVVRISEHHLFGGLDDPSLGEMNYYPRLAHMLAALVGVVSGSNFLGMQLVTMLSLSLIWGSTLSMVGTLERRWAVVSSLFLGLLLVLNKGLFRLEVHGYEVVANYFFSQLVAQAVAVFALAVALRLDRQARLLSLYIFMLGAIYVTTSIHLLPALLLVAVLIGVLALAVLNTYIAKSSLVKPLFEFVVFSALSLSAVLFNPAFSAMRKISENNGELNFKHISYPIGLSTVCVLVACISVYFILKSIRTKTSSYVFFKYFGLYGLAQASICLLQMALAKFGIGSDYAVKKYGFGLFAFILVAAAVVLGEWYVTKKRIRPGPKLFNESSKPEFAVLCVFALTLFIVVPIRKDFDALQVVALERQVTEVLSTAVPLGSDGKGPVVIGLPGMPQQFNYMFSIALAKTIRTLAIPDVLIANDLTDPNQYSYVVSAQDAKRYALPACQVAVKDGLLVSSSSCIAEHVMAASECAGTVSLSDRGVIAASRLTGFSHGEPEGRWMAARTNALNCMVHSEPPKHAQVILTPFFAAGLKEQRLQILVNGSPVKNVTFIPETPVAPIDFELPTLPENADLTMTFISPDAVSPKQLGLSDDVRTLSFFVRSVQFY